jgi:septin family protein
MYGLQRIPDVIELQREVISNPLTLKEMCLCKKNKDLHNDTMNMFYRSYKQDKLGSKKLVFFDNS